MGVSVVSGRSVVEFRISALAGFRAFGVFGSLCFYSSCRFRLCMFQAPRSRLWVTGLPGCRVPGSRGGGGETDSCGSWACLV